MKDDKITIDLTKSVPVRVTDLSPEQEAEMNDAITKGGIAYLNWLYLESYKNNKHMDEERE